MTYDDEVLAMYLNDINKIPVLSHEEQAELVSKAQKGDKLSRDKVINSNLRFVVKIAKGYKNKNLDLIDLISEGNIGLLSAIDKFDVSKGYHFISYAVWWINQSILKAVSEKSRAIRLPLNRANELVRIEHAKKNIHGTYSETEEYEKIGEMLNMEPSHIREMINISKDMISLEAEFVNADNNHACVADFIEDTLYEKPEESVIDESMNEEINNVLNSLRPNEANVIRMRFGLDGSKPMSLKEVGDKCNLTKERIRQIEKHAIVRLQHPTRSRRLESFIA